MDRSDLNAEPDEPAAGSRREWRALLNQAADIAACVDGETGGPGDAVGCGAPVQHLFCSAWQLLTALADAPAPDRGHDVAAARLLVEGVLRPLASVLRAAGVRSGPGITLAARAAVTPLFVQAWELAKLAALLRVTHPELAELTQVSVALQELGVRLSPPDRAAYVQRCLAEVRALDAKRTS